jgi:predicted histone-like DNA-binding protein
MAIKIKTVERNNPGTSGGKENMYVATAVSDGEVSLEELTSRVEKMCTVHGADIRGVIYAIVKVAIDLLMDGKIVRIGELGSLRIGVNSKGEDSSEKVSVNSVKGAKVIFSPGKAIKRMLKILRYIKA